MKLFVVLAVLLGIASCETLKQNMLRKLDQCEKQLKDAMIDSRNHGFDNNLIKLNQLWVAVEPYRQSVMAVPDGTTSPQNGNIFQKIADFQILVSSVIVNPAPNEQQKARILYLAAIKDVFNLSFIEMTPARHVTDVLKIIEKENHIASGDFFSSPQTLENEKLELVNMYRTLNLSTENWVVPTFVEHYALANRTRAIIEEHIRHNMTQQANAIETDLKSFDNLTLTLARLFPINGNEKVVQFVKVSKIHFELSRKLSQIKRLDPTLKSTLLERIEVLEHRINSAINLNERRRLVFYTKALYPTKQRIASAKTMVATMNEDAKEKDAVLVINAIKELEDYVPVHSENPSPTENWKSSALYLAAMKLGKDPLGARVIYDVVTDIVLFENNTRSLIGVSSFDKLELESARKLLDLKYLTLENLLKGSYIPKQEDHEKRVLNAQVLARDLQANGQWSTQADLFWESSHKFEKSTPLLNQIIPIDSLQKIDEYYNAAQNHYKNGAELESYIGKLRLNLQPVRPRCGWGEGGRPCW